MRILYVFTAGAVLCMALLCSAPARAAHLHFMNCDQPRIDLVTADFNVAKNRVKLAKFAIYRIRDHQGTQNDDRAYNRFFDGVQPVEPRVLHVFTEVDAVLESTTEQLVIQCVAQQPQNHPNARAEAHRNQSTITLYPRFFDMNPRLNGPNWTNPWQIKFEQPQTIIHELTHYVDDDVIDHQQDYTCAFAVGSAMLPDEKPTNATNYEYFVLENVVGIPCADQ